MKVKEVLWTAVVLSVGALALGDTVTATDKGFPTKPIELVVHRGAGGGTSIAARIVAGTLSEILGTSVVVVNKPAGAGTAAAVYVAKSKPDGYTLLIANSATNGVLLATQAVSYQNSDFDFLAQFGTLPMVLAVRADAPWKTVNDLVAEAKKAPGKLKYSSSGVASQGQFLMELLRKSAGGLKIAHVPFKSGPESIAALLGGHVDMASTYTTELKGAVEAGRIRMLAVPEEKRLEDHPEVPTFAERGYPDVKTYVWLGIAARKGLPVDVSEKLKAALYKTIKHTEVRKMLVNIGTTPLLREGEEFARFVNEEEEKFRRIAKESGLRVE